MPKIVCTSGECDYGKGNICCKDCTEPCEDGCLEATTKICEFREEKEDEK